MPEAATEWVGYNQTNLQDCEVFKYTVHHVLLWKMLQLVNEVDHILTHWRSVDSVYKPAILETSVLRLKIENAKADHT